MLKYGLLFLFCVRIYIGWGQIQLEADPFAASFFSRNITQAELKEQLVRLASSDFEGRETGSPGLDKAAAYLINRLVEMGVEKAPSLHGYYQDVMMSYVQWEDLGVTINGQSFEHLRDFVCLHEQNQNLPNFKVKDVMFLGYGIDDPKYSDYLSNNTRGKTIMIYKGEPLDQDSLSIITGTKEPSSWANDLEKKLQSAAEHRVRIVLVVDPDIRQTVSFNRARIAGQKLHFGQIPLPTVPNTIYISPDMAKLIIGERMETFVQNRVRQTQTGISRPVHLPVDMNIRQHLTRNVLYSKNIMGIIPGTEPGLNEEHVVISAHYDHLGKKGNSIFYGADDNASGTAAVLEIMETLAEAKEQGVGPRRSVMCIFFTAEEKGLLGSQYYAENPVIPLDRTTVNVNIDMIGRIDQKHRDNEQYIYVIGSDRLSTELHKINESTNDTYSHLDLDYTYNAKNDPNRFYYRSDHYNFAKHGIPSIFFFSGVHEDYHQPTDTPDKILYDKYEMVTKHIFHLTWELANRQKRISVDVVDDTVYDR